MSQIVDEQLYHFSNEITVRIIKFKTQQNTINAYTENRQVVSLVMKVVIK